MIGLIFQNTELNVLLSYRQSWKNLTEEQRVNFRKTNGFKSSWSNTSIDNSFPHLTKSNGQLYASNGFELQKNNLQIMATSVFENTIELPNAEIKVRTQNLIGFEKKFSTNIWQLKTSS